MTTTVSTIQATQPRTARAEIHELQTVPQQTGCGDNAVVDALVGRSARRDQGPRLQALVRPCTSMERHQTAIGWGMLLAPLVPGLSLLAVPQLKPIGGLLTVVTGFSMGVTAEIALWAAAHGLSDLHRYHRLRRWRRVDAGLLTRRAAASYLPEFRKDIERVVAEKRYDDAAEIVRSTGLWVRLDQGVLASVNANLVTALVEHGAPIDARVAEDAVQAAEAALGSKDNAIDGAACVECILRSLADQERAAFFQTLKTERLRSLVRSNYGAPLLAALFKQHPDPVALSALLTTPDGRATSVSSYAAVYGNAASRKLVAAATGAVAA